MSKAMDRLIAALQKEGFAPAPPPQAPPGAPPMDPNAAAQMPPPADPNAGAPVDPAMAAQMPMDPAAMQGMPPPVDPNAMPPVDPATGQPIPPPGAPMDPNAQPPAPTLAEIPVDQFMAMMQDMLDQSKGAPEEGEKKTTVADLDKRIGNLEDMLSQLLQASGMMPPEQGAPAGAMPPPPPAPDAVQKTAALEELKSRNNVKNAALAAQLRKIGKVVR